TVTAFERLRHLRWEEAVATPVGRAGPELRAVLDTHLSRLIGQPTRTGRFLRELHRLDPTPGGRLEQSGADARWPRRIRDPGGGAGGRRRGEPMTPMDVIVSLCKRRGFVFQSSEIYGGTGSCWDYGPLGVELKNNIKRIWWRDFVQQRGDMVGLDASILMHPTVWKASGHVELFTDPMVDCRECRRRFRADQVDELPWTHFCEATKGNKFQIPAGEPCRHCGQRRSLCPECGKGQLTAPRQFNLMFKTFMGPVEEDAAVTYLRPETAQGIFVNFDNVLQATRRKLPFGVAQIG